MDQTVALVSTARFRAAARACRCAPWRSSRSFVSARSQLTCAYVVIVSARPFPRPLGEPALVRQIPELLAEQSGAAIGRVTHRVSTEIEVMKR